MREYFNKQGIKIEKTYYCPHAPEINCECRKPKPGMLLQAIQEHDIDIQHSWFIGDKITDFEAGNAAGVHSLLIDSLYVKDMNIKKFRDLAEAVHYILLRDKNI
jgi:D-glycero-D-manno-heptose 1,7-bisphosphate phosphatase